MTTTQTARPRSNTYAGRCANCGSHVAAGAGHLGAKVDSRWTVTHAGCGTAAKPAARPAGNLATPAQVNLIMSCIARGDWHDSDAGQGFDAPTAAQVARMSRRDASALIDDLRSGF